MKIVIDLSEKIYKDIHSLKFVRFGLQSEENRKMFYRLVNATQSGTPLPKGHGRLIDISEYEDNYTNVEIQYDDGNHVHSIFTNMIPTVIEADKTESEE